jgi:hypothetical protein
MSFYTCFDWFNKLKLFDNERNLKIDVVLKASRGVVVNVHDDGYSRNASCTINLISAFCKLFKD